jgi:hypothetical protein
MGMQPETMPYTNAPWIDDVVASARYTTPRPVELFAPVGVNLVLWRQQRVSAVRSRLRRIGQARLVVRSTTHRPTRRVWLWCERVAPGTRHPHDGPTP